MLLLLPVFGSVFFSPPPAYTHRITDDCGKSKQNLEFSFRDFAPLFTGDFVSYYQTDAVNTIVCPDCEEGRWGNLSRWTGARVLTLFIRSRVGCIIGRFEIKLWCHRGVSGSDF